MPPKKTTPSSGGNRKTKGGNPPRKKGTAKPSTRTSQEDIWSSVSLYGPLKSRFPWTVEDGGSEASPQESLLALLERNLLDECLRDPAASSTCLDIAIINSLKLTLTSDGVLGPMDHVGSDRSCYKLQGSGQKELKLHMAADSPIVKHLDKMAQSVAIPAGLLGWRCQGMPWRILKKAITQFKCPVGATIAVSISFRFLKSERLDDVRRPLSDILQAPLGPEVSRLKDAILALGIPKADAEPIWTAIAGASKNVANDMIKAQLQALSSGSSATLPRQRKVLPSGLRESE